MRRFETNIQPNWDIRAAFNFILGGCGSAFLALLVLNAFPAVPSLVLTLIALAMMGAGLFSVWLEIGRPWRAINVFFHPHTSWMSREAILAIGAFASALTALYLGNVWLSCAAGIFGLGFLYCQGRILRASTGIPAWREPAVVYLVISTGLCEGGGLLLAYLSAVNRLTFGYVVVLVMLLAARACAWQVYKARILRNWIPERFQRRLAINAAIMVYLGTVVPIVLLWIYFCAPWLSVRLEQAGLVVSVPDSVFGALISLMVVGVGWYTKYNIVVRLSNMQGFVAIGNIMRGRPKIVPPIARSGYK